MKVFIDTNILIDWLCENRPGNENAKIIISACENKVYNLTISTQSLIDAAYTLRKSGLPFDSFIKSVTYLRSNAEIIGIDKLDLIWAVSHYTGDFEDDMQYVAAYNAVCVITL